MGGIYGKQFRSFLTVNIELLSCDLSTLPLCLYPKKWNHQPEQSLLCHAHRNDIHNSQPVDTNVHQRWMDDQNIWLLFKGNKNVVYTKACMVATGIVLNEMTTAKNADAQVYFLLMPEEEN